MDLPFPALWEDAVPWPDYLQPGMEKFGLWKGVYDHAVIPGWALEQFMRGPARRLLVISADWCGDAANTVPVLARLADLIPALELRILEREKYPAVMNRYLTNGTRSIPIAIALDGDFGELGHWGPRPSVLQDWVMARKVMPTPQRYAYACGWYARDKGESTLRELLAAISG